ncbi:MAG: extracellular solute-binding protein [Ignavibacteria bacterium]|nr:extracellular solute-binding protein [Ignavibacteria bacterium]
MPFPRRTTRRSAALLLAAGVCAVALLLGGCGGGKGGDAVTYQCGSNALEIQALERDIPAFTKRTGIGIALNPFNGDEKLYAMVAAGQEPDIFTVNNVLRDRFASEGRILDLRPFAEKDPFADRLLASARADGVSLDGGWYSVSNWAFTVGVYYNRALFAEAGIAPPDSTWTWDDMVATARRLTRDANGDGKTDRYGVFIGSHFIEAFEQMNHAPLPREALFLSLSPEARDVYVRYLALMQDGLMPDTRRVQAMGMQAPQMLENGTVAMLVEAVPNTNLFETLTIDWALAPLPRFAGKAPRYFRSHSGGLAISARTRHPQRAWEALKWIVSGASVYQPNPVLRDADFAGGWERKHARLAATGFRDVWRLAEQQEGGDPRYFVRFSSFTMAPILERFQPLLDRLWSRSIGIDELAAAVPGINARVAKDLENTLATSAMKPVFRDALRRQLAGQRPADGK